MPPECKNSFVTWDFLRWILIAVIAWKVIDDMPRWIAGIIVIIIIASWRKIS